MTKIAGSGSISQRHGSADPKPYQNVTALRYVFSRFRRVGRWLLQPPVEPDAGGGHLLGLPGGGLGQSGWRGAGLRKNPRDLPGGGQRRTHRPQLQAVPRPRPQPRGPAALPRYQIFNIRPVHCVPDHLAICWIHPDLKQ
jgi:hypothetical protein